MLAQVVAGSVFIVLWPLVRPTDEMGQILAALLLGAASVACAYYFIAGALFKIPRWLNTRKS